MADQLGMVLEHLKELRQDHKDVSASIAELKTEVKNLAGSIERLTEVDKNLHARIDKKDERIRDVEQRLNDDENKFAALEAKIESTSKTNRLWILAGAAVTTAIATAAGVLTAVIMSRG